MVKSDRSRVSAGAATGPKFPRSWKANRKNSTALGTRREDMTRTSVRLSSLPGMTALLLALCWSGTVFGYGVDSGTVITNATLTNQSPNYAISTNPGNLSAVYSNASGLAYNAFVKAPAARTRVTNAYDLSYVLVKSPAVNNASAGMNVYFTNFVTNWGNFTASPRFQMVKLASAATWTNSYSLYLNNAGVASNAEAVNYVLAGVTEGSPVKAILRVTVPPSMADGSSNRLALIVDDQAPFPGDAWPGTAAITPATPDLSNRRDYQTNWFVVKVAGPILDITKSADITAGIRPFQVLTYTITVTNRGSADAYKVSLRDVLPSNVTNLVGTVRVWTNSAAVSNAGPFTEAVDGDGLAVIGQKVTFGLGVVRPGKASRLKIDVRVR
jgi:uncharacterized repeat protein (TIGR01451 family)